MTTRMHYGYTGWQAGLDEVADLAAQLRDLDTQIAAAEGSGRWQQLPALREQRKVLASQLQVAEAQAPARARQRAQQQAAQQRVADAEQRYRDVEARYFVELQQMQAALKAKYEALLGPLHREIAQLRLEADPAYQMAAGRLNLPG